MKETSRNIIYSVIYLLLLPLGMCVMSSCGSDGDSADANQSTLTLSRSGIDFPNTRSIKTVTVSSNTSWTVSTNNCPWISVNKLSGVGNAVIEITVTDNDVMSQRKATLTVTTTDGSLTRAVKITQEKSDELIKVSESSVEFSGESTRKQDVTVKSAPEWTIVSQPDWVDVQRNGNILSISPKQINQYLNDNTGTIKLNNKSGYTATISVKQNGAIPTTPYGRLYDPLCLSVAITTEFTFSSQAESALIGCFPESMLEDYSDEDFIEAMKSAAEPEPISKIKELPTWFLRSAGENYVIAILTFYSNGTKSTLTKTRVSTKPSENQPLAKISNMTYQYVTGYGNVYASTITKSSNCSGYYVVSYNMNVSVDLVPYVAWIMREKIRQNSLDKKTSSTLYWTTNQLCIITWAMDSTGEMSGDMGYYNNVPVTSSSAKAAAPSSIKDCMKHESRKYTKEIKEQILKGISLQ